MHIKALTASLAFAVFAAIGSFGHAKALSPTVTTSNKTNISATKVASKSKIKVKVASGDTLSRIAKQHKTTYIRIFNANKQIKDPDLIFPGQTLRIPAASEHLSDRLKLVPATSVKPFTNSAPRAKTVTKKAVIVPKHKATRTHSVKSAPVVHTTGSSVWDKLAKCESSGNWSINTGNGFYGGLQFTVSSWHAVGGSGYPNQASRSEQIARAKLLQARQGWGAWPACSAKLGLR